MRDAGSLLPSLPWGCLCADNPARGSRRKELCWPAASGRALSTGRVLSVGARALSGGGDCTRRRGPAPSRGSRQPSLRPHVFSQDTARHEETCGPHSRQACLLPEGSKKTSTWFYIESAVGHTKGCVIRSRMGEELPSTQKGSQRGPHSASEDRSLRDGSRVLEEASW